MKIKIKTRLDNFMLHLYFPKVGVVIIKLKANLSSIAGLPTGTELGKKRDMK